MAFHDLGRTIRNLKGRPVSGKSRQKQRHLRRLIAETLESRQLLAGDLIAEHNYLIREDVNKDRRVDPVDAVIVLNEINRGEATVVGEGPAAAPLYKTDVNADGFTTPLDALNVLNAVAAGEGIHEVLEIQLDVTQNGQSIVNPDREFSVEIGETFDLEVRYLDLRDPIDRLGVFSIYTDLISNNIDSYRPVLGETQIIELNQVFQTVESGFLTLNVDGVGSTNIPFLAWAANAPSAIKTALEVDLGLGTDSVDVIERNSLREVDDPFRYFVRFTGSNFDFVDAPTIGVDTSNLVRDDGTGTGTSIPVVVNSTVTEVPVFTDLARTQINPDAFLFNVDFTSSSMGDFPIYDSVISGAYNPGNVETFNEVGGTGPIEQRGLAAFAQSIGRSIDLSTSVEAFSIELQATRPSLGTTFTVDLPENRGSEILVYGEDTALSGDLILIDLDDDPLVNGTDQFGMVVGLFGTDSSAIISTGDDILVVDEDSGPTEVNVLANDVNNGGGTLTVQSVANATNGSAIFRDGVITYEPLPDFFGNDSFRYVATNGTESEIGTVNVTVNSVNDPPTANSLTLNVPRGGTLSIPFSSFLNNQPANEVGGIAVTSAVADIGAASLGTGNILYQAPSTASIFNDQINVTFTDGQDNGSVALFINITDTARPQAMDDVITVTEDMTAVLSVDAELLSNDIATQGTAMLSSLNDSNSQGSVLLNANGTFIYTPPANVFGNAVDSFTYIMTDGLENSDPATVLINILAVNDPPVAGNTTASINRAFQSSINIDLSSVISPGAGEAGQPGQTVQVSGISAGSQGSNAQINPDGTSITYTPSANGFTGIETLIYNVADQGGLQDDGVITINVSNTGGGGGNGTSIISGAKFHDLDNNGQRDAGEPGIQDWTIFLDLNGNGTLDQGEPSTLTDANGRYEFTNLEAGTYSVREVLQAGWRQTFPLTSNARNITVETGNYVGEINIVDFDGDNDQDIIVANDYDNATTFHSSITLLTNDGAANFATTRLDLPENSRPQAIVAQDLTGDGIIDLAIASAGAPRFPTPQSNGVHVFIGTGAGFNANPSFFTAGDGPTDLEVADLNGDGLNDIITVNHRSDDVSVLLGVGGGTFADPINVPVGLQPIALDMADINGDGQQDVVVANYDSGSISILSGNNGNFTSIGTLTGIANPTDVVIEDINSDGNADLFVADSGNRLIRTFFGNGAGAFVEGASSALDETPESLTATDINHDGHVDLFVANRFGNAAQLENNGDGTFSEATDRVVELLPGIGDGALAKSIDAADLDGDNNADYVIGFVTGGISIHTTGQTGTPGPYTIVLGDDVASENNDFGNFQFEVAPTLPTVSLSASPLALTEDAQTSLITATLSEASSSDVVVSLGFTGTASLNADYSVTSTQITIPAGSTSATTTLTTIDDAIDELTEQMVAEITAVSGATENGVQTAIVSILDNDTIVPDVQLSVVPVVIDEGEAANIRVTLNSPSTQDVVVTMGYTGTAVRGEDYTVNDSITIPAGVTSRAIPLASIEDTLNEVSESVTVDIISVVGARELGQQTQSLTILDDDLPPPTVTLTASTSPIPETGGFAQLVADLSHVSPTDTVIQLDFTGTATINVDYNTPTSITVPAGLTTAAIRVDGVDDVEDEPDETLTATVTSVGGAAPVNIAQASVTILDNDEPTVSLSATPGQITEDGGIAEVIATLSSLTTETVVVDLDYTGGSALLGQHFTGPTQLVIPPNTLQVSGFIQALNNQDIENDDRIIHVSFGNSSTEITIINEDGLFFPLRASGTPMDGFGTVVTDDDIDALQAASLQIWQDAGLNEAGLSQLRDTEVSIEDLEGDLLGLGGSDGIIIDTDAAGFGWFVDATPFDDAEFTDRYFNSSKVTMDLLTVLLHEQGHVLGLDDGSSELMLEKLTAGARRSPSASDVDKAINELF